MRKQIIHVIIICLLSVTSKIYAQDSYSILYQKSMLDKQDAGAVNVFSNCRLIFNDSISFFYNYPNRADRLKNSKVFGDKLIHHGWIHKPGDNILAEQRTLEGKQLVLYEDRFIWSLTGKEKMIAGYKCFSAITITGSDTTLAWYSTEMNNPYGPFWYAGLPGVIMEVIDQQRGWHVIAVKVEKGNYTLVFPKNKKIVTRDEFLKRR